MASKQDESLFHGKKSEVEAQMLDLLRLGGNPNFPTGRLGTLWNNKSWASKITSYCSTTVGKDTFNISKWEQLASRRFDAVSCVYMNTRPITSAGSKYGQG